MYRDPFQLMTMTIMMVTMTMIQTIHTVS